MLWNVGGGKIQSSSDLVSSAQDEPMIPPVRREARGSENREQGV